MYYMYSTTYLFLSSQHPATHPTAKNMKAASPKRVPAAPGACALRSALLCSVPG